MSNSPIQILVCASTIISIYYSCEHFSRQRLTMVSHNKSSRGSRTLPSILADLNNAVIWMVFTCFLISKFQVPLQSLWGLIRTHQLQLISPSLTCSMSFLVLLLRLGTYLSFRFLLILLSGLQVQ